MPDPLQWLESEVQGLIDKAKLQAQIDVLELVLELGKASVDQLQQQINALKSQL